VPKQLTSAKGSEVGPEGNVCPIIVELGINICAERVALFTVQEGVKRVQWVDTACHFGRGVTHPFC
jgi:hypothetical protein